MCTYSRTSEEMDGTLPRISTFENPGAGWGLKILGISKAIKVFESPYYVFGNLSVISIYAEVLGLCKPFLLLKKQVCVFKGIFQ